MEWPSGNLLKVCYWTYGPCILDLYTDLPIKDCDFPVRYVSLPEGIWNWWVKTLVFSPNCQIFIMFMIHFGKLIGVGWYMYENLESDWSWGHMRRLWPKVGMASAGMSIKQTRLWSCYSTHQTVLPISIIAIKWRVFFVWNGSKWSIPNLFPIAATSSRTPGSLKLTASGSHKAAFHIAPASQPDRSQLQPRNPGMMAAWLHHPRLPAEW